MTTPTSTPDAAPDRLTLDVMAEARKNAVELEQCSMFVDSTPLKKAMTDAADFLRRFPDILARIAPGAAPAGEGVLRPCPFCGSSASKGYRDTMNWCGCTNVNCTVMPQAVDYVSDEALVAAWNTRARPARDAALTDILARIAPGAALAGEGVASVEASTRQILTSAKGAIDRMRQGLREGCTYRDRLLSIGEMDALSDLIAARLAAPSPARSDRAGAEGREEVVERREEPGTFASESGGSDGECYVTNFYGPSSRQRAEEYAAWKNAALAAAPTPAGEGVEPSKERWTRYTRVICRALGLNPDDYVEGHGVLSTASNWSKYRPAALAAMQEADREARPAQPTLAAGTDEALRVAIVPSKAAQDVFEERRRQVDVEGWTPKHDDEHARGELLDAALCYVQRRSDARIFSRPVEPTAPARWPWELSWWKPKDERHDLVKAGALILAELERLDRRTALGASGREG